MKICYYIESFGTSTIDLLPVKKKVPLPGFSNAPSLKQVLKNLLGEWSIVCWQACHQASQRKDSERKKKQFYRENRKKLKRYFVHLKKPTFDKSEDWFSGKALALHLQSPRFDIQFQKRKDRKKKNPTKIIRFKKRSEDWMTDTFNGYDKTG